MTVQYWAYKYLKDVDETRIGTENHFGDLNLTDVHKVCNSMLSDMCKVYGLDTPQNSEN